MFEEFIVFGTQGFQFKINVKINKTFCEVGLYTIRKKFIGRALLTTFSRAKRVKDVLELEESFDSEEP